MSVASAGKVEMRLSAAAFAPRTGGRESASLRTMRGDQNVRSLAHGSSGGSAVAGAHTETLATPGASFVKNVVSTET